MAAIVLALVVLALLLVLQRIGCPFFDLAAELGVQLAVVLSLDS